MKPPSESTPLTELMIDTGTSEPNIAKTLSNHHEAQSLDEGCNKEAPYSKGDMRKVIQLVSTHHSCPKRRQRKTSGD